MKQIDFGSGSLIKNVMVTAGPMMAAQFFSLLYNIVDRIYIGRIQGSGLNALAGVGICFPLITILTAFASLFGSGGAPLYAIERGKGNQKQAESYLNASFQMLLISSIILMIICLIFCRPILILFGADESSFPYAYSYMRIYLLGTVFSMLASGLNPFVNAQGYPGMGMMTILVGAAANILLDPLFIFAFDLGIAGAAGASVLSQILSCLTAVWFLHSKKAQDQISLKNWRSDLTLKRVTSIVSLGAAGFIMQITNSITQILSNSILSHTGGSLYVSVMTIVNSVRQILDTPILGFADGTSPILSYNYGAGNYERTRKTIWIMTALLLGYTAVVWGAILLMPGAFIDLFADDPSLKQTAVPALLTYFFAFIFQGLQYSGQTVFKALNQKGKAIFFSLFRKIIIVVPLTIWLPHLWNLGAQGVFLAEPVSNLIGGSICFATMLVTVIPMLKKDGNRNAMLMHKR